MVNTPAKKLFSELKLGSLTLKNRIVMASMTRNRSQGAVPDDEVVKYYQQRSSAGLILSEGVLITPQGTEWPAAPGIWSQEQVKAWKKVTDAVHASGSVIFAQLWHLGRAVHPLHQCGLPALAPSAVKANGGKYRYLEGTPTYTTPVPIEDPETIIEDFRKAAVNAKAAGFDGVELHSANGYLPAQFLESHSNKRTDKWGGSIENRCRFGLRIIEELVKVYGDSKRVGIKISPGGGYNDMGESTVEEATKLYTYYVQKLDELKIGYIQYSKNLPAFDPNNRGHTHDFAEDLRAVIKNSLFFVNGGYFDAAEAEKTLTATSSKFQGELSDAIAFARAFVANPDLPKKLKEGQVNHPDYTTLYGAHGTDGLLVKKEVGYTTY